jgi:hypothetical protein
MGYLADGGLWNNLGTQVTREDGFVRGARRRQRETPAILLSANGSRALQRGGGWRYNVPGLAPAFGALRGMRILAANTVTPRVRAIRQLTYAGLEVDHEGRPPRMVVDLVADASEDPEDLFIDLGMVEARLDKVSGGSHYSGPHHFAYLTEASSEWGKVLEMASEGAMAPTTLGPMPSRLAGGAFARGYANTTLMLTLLETETLGAPSFDSVLQVLDRIRS